MVHHWRKSGQALKQGRNLKAGADAEDMEECCILACFTWLCSACFLIEPKTTSPHRTSHYSICVYPTVTATYPSQVLKILRWL